MARLRDIGMNDLGEAGAVAYATGFFGASAAAFFPDPELFADLWVAPYLLGGLGVAAEAEGRVVGYAVAALSPRAYRRALRRTLRRRVLPKLLSGGYPAAWPSAPYLLRLARYAPHAADPRHFPAHLHLNVLPEARGQGVGGELLNALLQRLEASGATGVQLSTTTENQAALALYHKAGFWELRRYSSPLWRPWLGRDARHVVMVLELAR